MRDCSVSVSLTRAFRPALPKTPQNKIDKPLVEKVDNAILENVQTSTVALEQASEYPRVLKSPTQVKAYRSISG
ncbi:hypothetical protein Cal7507_2787 [Calothrix sp. PCC 7507]|nr:hypothetical protein Cal7507_2787 [Calothrix sp. PCC 7507]